MNSNDRINYLNIGLMAFSAIAAFLLPFELFLFVYAVLGPLHYLTEISWLHEKRYFTKHKLDYVVLAGLAVMLLALGFGVQWFVSHQPPELRKQISLSSQSWGTGAVYIAFAGALVMATVKKLSYRLFAFVFILVTAVFLKDLNSSFLFFSIFLPTLVHVFIFTGAFVLYGALKSRSLSGVLSFVAFLLCPVFLYVFNEYGTGRVLSTYVEDNYKQFFAPVNQALIRVFHLGTADTPQDVFYSSYGILAMRFIAFAYTYHYLNWFSKTQVIRWHEVSKGRLAFIVGTWLLALALYGYNYKTGLIALYCLSFMHVFLEFPLNHVTFIGIGKEMSRIAKDRSFRPVSPATASAVAATE